MGAQRGNGKKVTGKHPALNRRRKANTNGQLVCSAFLCRFESMKLLIALLLLGSTTAAFSQKQTKAGVAIRQLLAQQSDAWNKGDLEAFMQPYWNSDSLLFIGKSGVKHGWAVTLANYKKGYPDTAAMGKLHFDILETRILSSEYVFLVGKWHLQRTIGDIGGHFTLLFRRIKGQWKIIADHSS